MIDEQHHNYSKIVIINITQLNSTKRTRGFYDVVLLYIPPSSFAATFIVTSVAISFALFLSKYAK